jgi:hypothetical protein
VISAFRFGWLRFPQEAAGSHSQLPPAPTGVTIIDGLAFFLVYTLPFALSFFVFRYKNPASQAAVWLVAGILALLGSVTTFSSIAFLFPVPALLLILAGLLSFWEAGLRQALSILGVALILLLVGIGAFYTLFAHDDPACWALIRTESGAEVWDRRPAGIPPVLPADPQPGEPLSWECTSYVTSIAESLSSMGLWALGIIALLGILPRWERNLNGNQKSYREEFDARTP